MKKIIKKVISYIIVIFIGLCFLNIIIQRIQGKIPSLFNHSVFVIITDSMTPDYKVDDVILVKKTEASKIKKGDVVTYIGNSGDYKGMTITHKVVEEPNVVDGVIHFQTQGIKQGAPLDPIITENQIIGVVSCKLTVIGFIYRIITTIWGFILIIVLPLSFLFVWQIIDMVKKDKEEAT